MREGFNRSPIPKVPDTSCHPDPDSLLSSPRRRTSSDFDLVADLRHTATSSLLGVPRERPSYLRARVACTRGGI